MKFFIALIILLFSCAQSDAAAPGYQNPGSRVPPRTQVAAPKPAPKPKPKPKPAPKQPKQAPAPVVTALEQALPLFQQERYQKALPFLLRAIQEQPKNPDVWYWFGVWNDKTGNFANAQKFFAVALEIDPNYPVFSRVVVYPDDPHGKLPLWDPKRGARIERIEPVGEGAVAPAPKDTSPPRPLSINGEGEQSPLVPVYVPPDYVEMLEMEGIE